jgi:hypothetical protein
LAVPPRTHEISGSSSKDTEQCFWREDGLVYWKDKMKTVNYKHMTLVVIYRWTTFSHKGRVCARAHQWEHIEHVSKWQKDYSDPPILYFLWSLGWQSSATMPNFFLRELGGSYK